MKINTKKLEELIKAALVSIQAERCVSSGVAIGKIDGAQIQINVTRDPDDRWPLHKRHECISN